MSETTSKGRVRSPAYPSIGLKEAIEKLRVLYRVQKKNPVGVDVAITTLGFKSGGYGGRCIAAMKMFGLLQDEGKLDDRMVRITEFGLTFVLYEPDDTDYQASLKVAARRPTVYGEMLNEWPEDLPNDAQIRKWLIKKEFNPEYIQPLIDNFRSTYELANLSNRGTLSEDETDKNDDDQEDEQQDQQPPSSNARKPIKPLGRNVGGGDGMQGAQTAIRTLAIPMGSGRELVLQVPEQLETTDSLYLEMLETFIGGLKSAAGIPGKSQKASTEANND